MKPEELRIGNHIMWEDDSKDIETVKGIHFDESLQNWFVDIGEDTTVALWEFIEVPITEEWLEKFGFEKEVVEKENFTVYVYSMTVNEELIELKIEMWKGNNEWDDSYSFYKGWDYMSSCNYIHQLQNLYYALTGQELKLKEG